MQHKHFATADDFPYQDHHTKMGLLITQTDQLATPSDGLALHEGPVDEAESQAVHVAVLTEHLPRHSLVERNMATHS
jgi:hypothetical protein